MPTAQIAAEQIVIGALVLAAAALPWWPELHGRFADTPLVSGGVLIGICYVLGVLFDRIADTLTEELDRHHRLRFGLESRLREEKKAAKARKPPLPALKHVDDVYPEDRYRLAVLRDKEPVVTWMDYHRSRVRLTRAMAVYLPAVTVAAVVAGSRTDDWLRAGHELDPLWIAIVPAALVVFAGIGAIRSSGDRDANWRLRCRAVHTYSAHVEDYARLHGLSTNSDSRLRRGFWLTAAVVADPAFLAGVVLLLGALRLAREAGLQLPLLLWGVGAVLSVMSALAWWRINATFRTYLRDAGGRNAPGERNWPLV